ncbi:MAG: hypothetical protein Q9213_002102 [Squamulea squamosa]
MSWHSSRNPFLTAVDFIVQLRHESINFEECYWTSDGDYTGIRGSTEIADRRFTTEFHIQPKLSQQARNCTLVVRARQGNVGTWRESHMAMEPSAPEVVHEIFAALIHQVPRASVGTSTPLIARLLLNGRLEDQGTGFAQIIDEARGRLE